MKHGSSFVGREISANVFPLVASAGRNAEIRISIAGGVASKALISADNRTILNLCIRPEAIERPAWTVSYSAVR